MCYFKPFLIFAGQTKCNSFNFVLSPALGLLQFAVSSLWMILNPLTRVLLDFQGLMPLDPSARTEFRAICYRQSPRRCCQGLCHASSRSSSFPLPQPIPFLRLSLLGTALGRQIGSLLLFLSVVRIHPLPLPLFRAFPLSLNHVIKLNALLFLLL